MKMRLVEFPAHRPHHCAVLPQIAGSRVYATSGSDLAGEAVYVSDVAFKEMAPLFGFVSITQVRAVQAEAAALSDRIRELEAENRQLTQTLDAIDVLESADFTRRRKPGRPRKHEEEVAA